MINIGRIVNSRNFAQPGGYTVYRQSGAWVSGRWTAAPEEVLQLQGTVTPVDKNDLLQVPEGDRVTGMMCFYSEQPIYTTRAQPAGGTSDEIVWREDRYRIVSIGPWNDFGFCQAFGVRMVSD